MTKIPLGNRPNIDLSGENTALVDDNPPNQIIDIWDSNEPRSVVNLVPDVISSRMRAARQVSPELFTLDEQDLFKTISSQRRAPTATDNRLRMKFWMEYDYCQAFFLKGIEVSRVVAGVCHREYFYHNYLMSPSRVAWMLCPPISYALKNKEALEFGIDQLRDILAYPHVKPNGTLDTQAARIKAQIVAMIDNRVNGAVLQKTMNLNVDANGVTGNAIARVAMSNSMEGIEKKLKSLRELEHALSNGGLVSGGETKEEVQADIKGVIDITGAGDGEAGES